MRATGLHVVPTVRGLISPGGVIAILLCLLTFRTNLAQSEDLGPAHVEPDPPARASSAAPTALPAVGDLDGLYVWLGPSAGAGLVDGVWDSAIGGDLAVVRIREDAIVGAIGASIGAGRWTDRGGGRVWLDVLAGTRIGRMVGVSGGPVLELDELHHPRLGGSVGVWAFLGVTPYVRVGTVDELGAFAELGVHVALPVRRWRR